MQGVFCCILQHRNWTGLGNRGDTVFYYLSSQLVDVVWCCWWKSYELAPQKIISGPCRRLTHSLGYELGQLKHFEACGIRRLPATKLKRHDPTTATVQENLRRDREKTNKIKQSKEERNSQQKKNRTAQHLTAVVALSSRLVVIAFSDKQFPVGLPC